MIWEKSSAKNDKTTPRQVLEWRCVAAAEHDVGRPSSRAGQISDIHPPHARFLSYTVSIGVYGATMCAGEVSNFICTSKYLILQLFTCEGQTNDNLEPAIIFLIILLTCSYFEFFQEK